MSKETAKKLIAELETNKELYDKVQGIEDPAELVKIALDAGYDVTLEELRDAEKEYRRDKAAETDEKLSFDDLEDVAGGYKIDEAPDGHDMACLASYHTSKGAKETNTWCSKNYYCSSADAQCIAFVSDCNYTMQQD